MWPGFARAEAANSAPSRAAASTAASMRRRSQSRRCQRVPTTPADDVARGVSTRSVGAGRVTVAVLRLISVSGDVRAERDRRAAIVERGLGALGQEDDLARDP